MLFKGKIRFDDPVYSVFCIIENRLKYDVKSINIELMENRWQSVDKALDRVYKRQKMSSILIFRLKNVEYFSTKICLSTAISDEIFGYS